jgi:hypothetical protein
MSLNFGKRGILGSVEKVARDLLDLEQLAGFGLREELPRPRPRRPEKAPTASCTGRQAPGLACWPTAVLGSKIPRSPVQNPACLQVRQHLGQCQSP